MKESTHENLALMFRVIPQFPKKKPLVPVGVAPPSQLLAEGHVSAHQFGRLDRATRDLIAEKMHCAYPHSQFLVLRNDFQLFDASPPTNRVPLYLDAIIANPSIGSEELIAMEEAAGENAVWLGQAEA